MIAFFLIVATGFIFAKLYPWIHQTFYNSLPEAEVQTYIAGIITSIVLLSLWFWFGKWRIRIGLPPPKLLLGIIVFIGIGALLLFQQNLTQNQELITFFQSMEVMPSSFTPVSYLVVTFILYLLFVLF